MSYTRVALVTGANKGIGFTILRDLCQQFSGDVVLTARDTTRGQAAVQQLQAQGLSPRFHQLDIDDPQSIRTLRDFLLKEYGGLDLLVNNAGITYKSRVVNMSSIMSLLALKNCSPELQRKFTSETITEEELVGLMMKFVEDTKNGVHIKEGWPDVMAMAYAVSKMGITVLSRIYARRLSEQRRGDKILLNACCPGWVKTDMGGPEAIKTPEEGAETPVYLALLPSDAKGPHGEFVMEKKVEKWGPLCEYPPWFSRILSLG
uniref:Carbonyl reductase (NADPH) n=1 Tax=Equus caballus TaxID=9796 RepID=A0A9L0T5G0_HORSE